MEAYDPYWSVAYFLTLVLAAGWLAGNLTLAVIFEQVHVHNVRQAKLREADAGGVSAERRAFAHGTVEELTEVGVRE